MLEPRDYTDMQSMTDEAWPPGRLYYWKSSLVRTLGEEAIDVFLEYAARKPTALSVIGMQQLHGAAGRVDTARTAFPHRFDHYNCLAMLETEDHTDVESGTELGQAVLGGDASLRRARHLRQRPRRRERASTGSVRAEP